MKTSKYVGRWRGGGLRWYAKQQALARLSQFHCPECGEWYEWQDRAPESDEMMYSLCKWCAEPFGHEADVDVPGNYRTLGGAR